MGSESSASAVLPAYVSYTSFKNFLQRFSETGLPSQINRGVFGNSSGSHVSAMTAALKWLKLIDENGAPRQKFKDLVAASNSDGYAELLKEIIFGAYPFIGDGGSIDLENDTTQHLESEFRELGVSGSTLTKAVTFFLAAAREAGFKIGPHIKTPSPKTTSGERKRVRKSAKGKDSEVKPPPAVQKPGMIKITVPLHGMADGEIYLPDGLNAAQWKYALHMATVILSGYRNIPDESSGGVAE